VKRTEVGLILVGVGFDLVLLGWFGLLGLGWF